MHKQECHPDRPRGGPWTATSPSILPACVCKCGSGAGARPAGERLDQGGRGGQGLLLQPLQTHAHTCLEGAVCSQGKQPVSCDTGAGRQLGSPRVWHLGPRLGGSRQAGLPVTEDLESCSVLATHALVTARTRENCLKQGRLCQGCEPQKPSTEAQAWSPDAVQLLSGAQSRLSL